MSHIIIPLNLPHAGRISRRIDLFTRYGLAEPGPEHGTLLGLVERLQELLLPFEETGENPAPEEACRVVANAADLGRKLVEEIERLRIGHDRLGQAVRNLFETLELGKEGARISRESPPDGIAPAWAPDTAAPPRTSMPITTT